MTLQRSVVACAVAASRRVYKAMPGRVARRRKASNERANQVVRLCEGPGLGSVALRAFSQRGLQQSTYTHNGRGLGQCRAATEGQFQPRIGRRPEALTPSGARRRCRSGCCARRARCSTSHCWPPRWSQRSRAACQRHPRRWQPAAAPPAAPPPRPAIPGPTAGRAGCCCLGAASAAACWAVRSGCRWQCAAPSPRWARERAPGCGSRRPA